MSYFLSWQKSNTLISDKKKKRDCRYLRQDIYASNQNKDGQYLFLLFSTWINIFKKK